ncbi:hypothetical protein VP01_944g1 [Puccinia sorghi]|uniref:Uncharacterized protein n=1 Tax=Puccinia sorghi TaxID=27349 RepID=A0A0L6U737_9BASI|nr:hypothetical protein VP01_944g1 [Puccinia sorghi]
MSSAAATAETRSHPLDISSKPFCILWLFKIPPCCALRSSKIPHSCLYKPLSFFPFLTIISHHIFYKYLTIISPYYKPDTINNAIFNSFIRLLIQAMLKHLLPQLTSQYSLLIITPHTSSRIITHFNTIRCIPCHKWGGGGVGKASINYQTHLFHLVHIESTPESLMCFALLATRQMSRESLSFDSLPIENFHDLSIPQNFKNPWALGVSFGNKRVIKIYFDSGNIRSYVIKPTSDKGEGNQEEFQSSGQMNKQGRPAISNNTTGIMLNEEKNASSSGMFPSNVTLENNKENKKQKTRKNNQMLAQLTSSEASNYEKINPKSRATEKEAPNLFKSYEEYTSKRDEGEKFDFSIISLTNQ